MHLVDGIKLSLNSEKMKGSWFDCMQNWLNSTDEYKRYKEDL